MKNRTVMFFVLAAVLLSSFVACDGSGANGTALFVTVKWDTKALKVYRMRISGMIDGTDSGFPTVGFAARTADGGVVGTGGTAVELPSDRTILVTLKESVGGSKVRVTLDLQDAAGAVLKTMTQVSPTIVRGREAQMTFDFSSPQDGGAGGSGGTGGSGGSGGAGGAGGSGGSDGGGISCTGCDAGCVQVDGGANIACLTGTTFPAGSGLVACANPGALVRVCRPFSATHCTGLGCRCGLLAACDQGQRCAETSPGSGTFSCVCDSRSCPGCCGPGGINCFVPDKDSCGNTGATCKNCTVISGSPVCSLNTMNGTLGLCLPDSGTPVLPSVCPSGQCRSTDTNCAPVNFPSCVDPLGPACLWCNSLISDSCPATGARACRCGTGPACTLPQRCLKQNGVMACVDIPQGL